MTAPSEACPYGECDGSGLITIIDNQKGEVFVRMCKCHEIRVIENKLKFACIPDEFKDLTVASFRVDLYKHEDSRARAALAKRIAVNFVKHFEQMQEKGKGLYFYSSTKGSGKTRLAASIGNALIKQYRVSVRFITTKALLDEIKSTFHEETGLTYSAVIDAIKRVDVLILDDIGTENKTDWVNETFFNIMDSRMTAHKITIFTSNTPIEGLKHDEKIRSRINKMAMPVAMPEESIRDALAQKENEELQVLLYR